MKRVIYACDVGSTLQQGRKAPAFAWARLLPNERSKSVQGSSDIQQLVKRLELDIEEGHSIALGFEAPLFIPVPEDWKGLSKGREGDGNRPWSASSGAYVTTLGIHQSAWILKRLHESSFGKCDFTLDWQRWWPPTGHRPVLFCWEAFVSGGAHSEHLRDAATAVAFFSDNEQDLQRANAVRAENAISLIWTVALWSGWTSDLHYLHKSALVLKPNSAFEGKIQVVS